MIFLKWFFHQTTTPGPIFQKFPRAIFNIINLPVENLRCLGHQGVVFKLSLFFFKLQTIATAFKETINQKAM